MTTSHRTKAIVLSPCVIYLHAWNSLLMTLDFVDSVQTATKMSEVVLVDSEECPTTILVDAPGSERRFAQQLEPFYESCHALFVVNDYELVTILPLLRLGGTGFALRSGSAANFVKAFSVTARGQIGLPHQVAKRAMAELAKARRDDPVQINDLTRREREVIQLLADGMSNRDIAQTLFLSVRTVEAHLRSLYGKLCVHSRTEAALWAVRHGYASPV